MGFVDREERAFDAPQDLAKTREDEALGRDVDESESPAFEGVEAEALMLALPDLALSAGSACSSGDAKPSHVLLACGRSEDLARGTLRFGLGRFTTEEEIDRALARVVEAVRQLRQAATV